MKVEISQLKAPWPAGAAVGDVVEIEGDAVPGWAVGKCKPAAADAEVTVIANERPADTADAEAQAAAERKVAGKRSRG